MKLLAWIRAPFAWKVVRQHDGYTYFENAVTGRRRPLERQRLGPRLQLHAIGRCLLWAVRASGLLGSTSVVLSNSTKGQGRYRPEAGAHGIREDCCAKRRSAIGLPNSQTPKALAHCWQWLRSNGESWRINQLNGKAVLGHWSGNRVRPN